MDDGGAVAGRGALGARPGQRGGHPSAGPGHCSSQRGVQAGRPRAARTRAADRGAPRARAGPGCHLGTRRGGGAVRATRTPGEVWRAGSQTLGQRFGRGTPTSVAVPGSRRRLDAHAAGIAGRGSARSDRGSRRDRARPRRRGTSGLTNRDCLRWRSGSRFSARPGGPRLSHAPSASPTRLARCASEPSRANPCATPDHPPRRASCPRPRHGGRCGRPQARSTRSATSS